MLHKLAALLALLSACVISCTPYGHRTQSGFSKLGQDTCSQKPQKVDLYFAGENVQFEYEKVGLVEALGGESASPQEVLDYLKYEAWRNCADAIIGIETNSATRERDTPFLTETQQYRSRVYSGLAVKYKSMPLRPIQTDTSFLKTIRNNDAAQKKDENFYLVMAILLGLVFGIALLVKYVK